MEERVEDKELVCLVTELLENAGDILESEKNPVLLRLLTWKLGELTKSSTDKRLVYLSQFLDGYINDIWRNMAIELTYEVSGEGEKIFRALLQEIGEKLKQKISEYLFEDKDLEYYEEIANLYTIYLSKLEELSKLKDTINFSTGHLEHPESVELGKRRILKILEEREAVLKCKHTLRSGLESDYFLNIDSILSDFESMNKISEAYAREVDKIKEEIDKLVFIEKEAGPIGSIFLVYPIMEKTQLSSCIIDLKKRIPLGRIKGTLPNAGESVAIISDTTTTGDTILKVANILREEGVKTSYAIALFDREAVAKRRLKKFGIKLIPILSQEDFIRAGMIEDYPREIIPPKEKIIIPPARWKIERYERGVGKKTVEQLRQLYIQI